MKINLLFLVSHGINKSGEGIAKKIYSQVKAFENLGINTTLSYLEVNNKNEYTGRTINEKMLEKYNKVFGKYISWKWRYKFNKLFQYIKGNKINVIYIRYTHFTNPFFIRFLNKIKKLGVYIIMEIPTYPYDDEYKDLSLSQKIIKKTEEHYRKYFSKYIDLIVTYTDVHDIFNVKTLQINNGIDIEKIKLRKLSDNESLHFIAIASMEFWHGYDRIIEGLKEYYSKKPSRKVYLNLVGNSDNKESNNYQIMIEKYNLEEYVIFHGYKKGEDLDKLFDMSDLGIGCLGVHRKGIFSAASLKNIEYCARGIPFIYAENDDSFEDKPFVYKIEPNESNVDIKQLVNYLINNKFEPEEIRKFAKDNLTWEIQMEKIISNIPFILNG